MNRGFKSFPKKLYGNTVKMLNVTARAFGMSKPSEIFYSIKDGSWQDITVWETVSGRVGRLPTANDDVYIKHSVTKSNSANCFCYNLFITENSKLTWDANNASFVNVYGNIQCKGTLDMNAASSLSHYLVLNGTINFIEPTKFFPNTNGIVSYRAIIDQPVLNLAYATLEITNPLIAGNVFNQGTKFLTADLVTTKDLITAGGVIDFGRFDVIINGALNGNQGFVKKTGSGNVLIVGLLTVNNFPIGFDFSVGNPTVELRGGISITNSNPPSNAILSGTGTWTFTTNNQTINTYQSQFYQTLDCPIVISGAITVTILSTGGLNLNNTLTGNNAASSLVNQGLLYFNTLTAASGFMTTGTHDFTTSANTVGYTGNYSYTLTDLAFKGLYIAGTGIKTQATGTNTIATTLTIASGATLTSAGNTTVTGTSSSTGTLNLLTYNWTFTGLLTSQPGASMTKTGAGALIFAAGWTMIDGAAQTLDFSGNPTVEMRNNFQMQATGTFNSGTGIWTFSTNSSTWNVRYLTYAWTAPILISGAITVTLTNAAGSGGLSTNNSIDGNNASSVFDNRAKLYVANASFPTPMVTLGTFITNVTSGARIGYIFNGNFTLPLTTYQELYIGGTGTKTLGGNTTCTLFGDASAQYGTTGGTFDCSTFNFTNTGATNIWDHWFKKTAAGSILFTGVVIARNNVAGGIDLSGGNPTIEFRGGINNGSTFSVGGWNFGSGTMTFSTNNQSYTATINVTQASNIVISGAITVTTSVSALTITGTINGNNAGSTLDNRSALNYQNATRPMVTGVLQCNGAANTWLYNLAGNQDVTGGTYRTLTLAGSGVKTLQGNVVVVTAYTLTAPATLNLNGFTRT